MNGALFVWIMFVERAVLLLFFLLLLTMKNIVKNI